MLQTLNFEDNKAAIARPDFYTGIMVDTCAVLKSWKLSVFSYEWLNADGSIKPPEALNASELTKRTNVEEKLQNGAPLEKPILGIGIQDNVEIGSGRAILLTLAAHGVTKIPVHIPKTNESDFKAFLADVT